jgi:eukaryotic-like serine/threonine-protein kinase
MEERLTQCCTGCGADLAPELPFCAFCGQTRARERAPQLVAGRFEITGELGRGGMGVVYAARDCTTGAAVALKVLLRERCGDLVARKRFLREIAALAAITHPQLVPIIASGAINGDEGEPDQPYFVSTLLTGESLSAVLERGALSPDRAAAIATDILAALAALHGAHLIHRDVKAANVMLLPDGHAMLLDLGIVRTVGGDETRLTATGQLAGTPEVLAPEQIEDRPLDARTDVYQVGALLLYMLLGHPAFAAESTGSWLFAHRHEEPAATPAERRSAPFLLDCAFRALAKSPRRRFRSASEMAAAIEAARQGRPLPPRRWWRRLWGG